jgi:uncharacterized protein YcfJ
MKLFSIFVFVIFSIVTQVTMAANPFCGPRYEVKTDPLSGERVSVQVPGSCANTQGQGDGVYNGRKTGGAIIGALLGGGLAHALGGDPSAIVSGVLGGAQTGTYVGSTYDQDKQQKDRVVYARSLCASSGTVYNNLTDRCEGEAASSVPATNRQPTTVAEAEEFCKAQGHTGYNSTTDQCYKAVSPTPVSMVTASAYTTEWCIAEADRNHQDKGGAAGLQKICARSGRSLGIVSQGGKKFCGCSST